MEGNLEGLRKHKNLCEGNLLIPILFYLSHYKK